MCFSFPYFSLVSGRTGRGTGRERERKRDHPLRDRVMDITDMLYNPPEFTIPSILITKKKKNTKKKRERKKKESRRWRERGGAIFSLPPVCACVLALADFHFYLAKKMFSWPLAEKKKKISPSFWWMTSLPTSHLLL